MLLGIHNVKDFPLLWKYQRVIFVVDVVVIVVVDDGVVVVVCVRVIYILNH